MLSCCGTDCSLCQYFPTDCSGCESANTGGKAFWFQFVTIDICPIYDCCVQKKKLSHCGQCEELPCSRYFEHQDPTQSEEERQKILEEQIKILRSR